MDNRFLLLDFGNVLFEIDFTKTVSALQLLCKQDVEIDFSAHSQLEIFNQFEIGAFTPKEFIDTFRQMYSNDSISDEQIISAWNALLLAPFADTEDVIVRLKKKGYTLALVSNTNAIHVDYFYPKAHSFLKHFDYFFYSHQILRRKPNRDYFEYVLKTMNLDPKNALYIDDAEQHLVTAKSMGITSYLKKSETTLSELLHTVNIL
jgi:HAD superfamily hydrolase (TIGR01509 family)